MIKLFRISGIFMKEEDGNETDNEKEDNDDLMMTMRKLFGMLESQKTIAIRTIVMETIHHLVIIIATKLKKIQTKIILITMIKRKKKRKMIRKIIRITTTTKMKMMRKEKKS